jgi:hypothetical protein
MKRADLERLKEHVDQLDPHEQRQIFHIIQKYTADFTQTETGVLVQANVLTDACLQEMKSYVAFCQDQRRRMEDDVEQRKTYERLVSSTTQ